MNRTIHPILSSCARAEGYPGFYSSLKESLTLVQDWNSLLVEAEEQRMGPLLYQHARRAGADLPTNVAFRLKELQIATRNSNHARFQVLAEILDASQEKGFEVLLLKGAAVTHLVYPDLSLRPMADLDLWVCPTQAESFYYLLGELGFQLAPALFYGVPRKNHHYAPVSIVRDRIAITVEVHKSLFRPGGEPIFKRLTFQQAWRASMVFDLAGRSARTLDRAQLLWHIYRHCCCGSLRYLDGDFRLIRIADLISSIEQWADDLDWDRIRKEYPELLRTLPLLHAVSPWSENTLAHLPMDPTHPLRDAGQIYQGYPSVYIARHQQRGLWQSLKDTFFPPEWWFRLHYGLPGRGWRYWTGRLYHDLRVIGDLLVYLVRLGLGFEKPDPVEVPIEGTHG